MATRIWSSTGSTNMNLASNYTGSGNLLTTDDLVFDNTSQISASSVASLIVNSITTSSNYTGVFSQGSDVITCNTSVILNHSGNLYLNGPINILSSGDFTIGTKIQSYDCSLLELNMLGDGIFTSVKTPLTLSKLNIAYPKKTTTINTVTPSGGGMFINNMLSVNGGSFLYYTIQYPIIITVGPYNASNYLYWHPDTICKSSHRGNKIEFRTNFYTNENLSIEIPKMRMEGSGTLSFSSTNPSGNVVFNLRDDLYAPSFYLTASVASSKLVEFNSNGNGLYASGYTPGTFANYSNCAILALTATNTSNQVKFDLRNSNITGEVFIYNGTSLSGVLYLDNANINLKAITPNYGFLITTKPKTSSSSGTILSLNIPSGIIRTSNVPLSYVDVSSSNVIISGALTTNRLRLASGIVTRFTSVSGIIVNNYINGDWDNATLRSSINGSNGPVTIPSGVQLYNVSASGCTFSNPIYTYNCRNLGGCANLVFPSSTKTSDRSSVVSRFLRR